jgi:hypothetical protein
VPLGPLAAPLAALLGPNHGGTALAAAGALPTGDAGRFAAVALVATLGAAGFAAGALREVEGIKRLQVLDK